MGKAVARRNRSLTIGVFVILSALAVLLVIGCTRTSLSDLDKRYVSLVEMDHQAYILKGDQTLFRFSEPDTLQRIAQLPSKDIQSDGTAVYYAEGKKIRKYSANDRKHSDAWKANKDIALDYASPSAFIYHSGNHFDYAYVDRASGQSRPLIDRTDARFFSLVAANDQWAVFAYSDFEQADNDPTKKPDAIYVLSLSDRKLEQLTKGRVQRAFLRNDLLYVASIATYSDGTASGDRISGIQIFDLKSGSRRPFELTSPKGPSSQANPTAQLQFNGQALSSIQTIAMAGDTLIIATDDAFFADGNRDMRHGGTLIGHSLVSGHTEVLQASIGLIDRLFVTTGHYSYYDLGDGISMVPGKAVVKMLPATLSSTSPSSNASPSLPTPVPSSMPTTTITTANPINVPFSIGVYKRSNPYVAKTDFGAQIILNRIELEKQYSLYLAELEKQSAHSSVQPPPALKTDDIGKYTDDYFKSHALIYVLRRQRDILAQDRFNALIRTGNRLIIDYTILRSYPTGSLITGWLVMLEVRKSDVAGVAEIVQKESSETVTTSYGSYKGDSSK
jgi:hypothetical protein